MTGYLDREDSKRIQVGMQRSGQQCLGSVPQRRLCSEKEVGKVVGREVGMVEMWTVGDVVRDMVVLDPKDWLMHTIDCCLEIQPYL